MKHINILTRRSFFEQALKVGAAAALASLTDVPLLVRRALAEGNIGLNGKKLLFIFMRGGEDGLNSIIPIGDSAYNNTNRPTILIPSDAGTNYAATGPCDFPISATAATPTFSYPQAIRLGNGFAALHPSLKFLAPVYNAGDLAIMHRVAYPQQSRSHFDSQSYWETGDPNGKTYKDGIFYRTIVESGLATQNALTGVSFQSALPLMLRGSKAAMTNLSSTDRYNLMGIPNTSAGNLKADDAIRRANGMDFPDKNYRELLSLQYGNLMDTLAIFSQIDFSEAGNTYVDDLPTDGDIGPYYLFPTTNAKNGGYSSHGNDPQKYVVDTGAYSFFTSLKAAAIVLNKTDAVIAGTEFSGGPFDTHNNQGSVTGSHANLMRRVGWAMYALRKYFTNYSDKTHWNNLVVVTLTEFGRTTIQNDSGGTDHAEAGVMYAAGGGIRGYNKGGSTTGIFGCHPTDTVNGRTIPWVTGQTGTMFGAAGRYLKRSIDYRSVLGELIRDHLGATQNQLNRIIPGYAVTGEHLLDGGTSTRDNVPIFGELGLI